MGNVANEQAATGINGFVQKLFGPISLWVSTFFATKAEVAAMGGLTPADDADADAVWDNYIFSTTD